MENQLTQSGGTAPAVVSGDCSAWALYRPDGTIKTVILGISMDADRENFLLADAWDEIRPEDYYAAGTPIPRATNEARAAGYRVVSVTISPNEKGQT